MSLTQNTQFRAVSGLQEGFGATPREALDALTTALAPAFDAPIVILPFNRGDRFFTQAQQDRLQELKARQTELSDAENAELNALIESAFDASLSRMQAAQPVKI